MLFAVLCHTVLCVSSALVKIWAKKLHFIRKRQTAAAFQHNRYGCFLKFAFNFFPNFLELEDFSATFCILDETFRQKRKFSYR